jgi:hypothetical protein
MLVAQRLLEGTAETSFSHASSGSRFIAVSTALVWA